MTSTASNGSLTVSASHGSRSAGRTRRAAPRPSVADARDAVSSSSSGAAVLPQQLPAAAARHEQVARRRRRRRRATSRPPPVRVQVDDQRRTRRTASRRTTRSRRCSPTRPGRRRPAPAAPTGNRRVRRVARRVIASTAAARRASQSIVGHGSSPLTYGSPSAAGARTRPTSPATAKIVARYGSIARNVDGIVTGVPMMRQHGLQRVGEAEEQRRGDRAARAPPAEDHRGQGDEALARA